MTNISTTKYWVSQPCTFSLAILNNIITNNINLIKSTTQVYSWFENKIRLSINYFKQRLHSEASIQDTTTIQSNKTAKANHHAFSVKITTIQQYIYYKIPNIYYTIPNVTTCFTQYNRTVANRNMQITNLFCLKIAM